MVEVTAFNWTYWFKSGLLLLIVLALFVMPIVVAYGFKTDRLLPKKILLPLVTLVIIIFMGHSYIQLPNIIKVFEENKKVFSGRLCGFKGAREWYSLCIDGVVFNSHKPSRNMRNDAIFNFGWIDKPKGCIEIEFLIYAEHPAANGYPSYKDVSIGRLRGIPCKE